MSSGDAKRIFAQATAFEMKSPEIPIEMAATFVCNIDAMTAEQRKKYRALTNKLQGAAVEIKELANGYAFRLESARLAVEEAAEWITYEKLCCPFFDFALEVERDGGAMWLRLTGPAGVKPFVKSEFKIR